MASIRDVARRARTSVGTVSRYLNNRSGVNDKTAQRIAAAIKALDYTPAVVTNRCQSIAVLAYAYDSPMGDPYMNRVLRGVGRAAFDRGYDLRVVPDFLLDRERSDLGLALRQRQMQGVILANFPCEDAYLRDVAEIGFPHVAINIRNDQPKLNWLCANHKRGMYEAVKHLVQFGHERIVYIEASMAFMHQRDQRQGFVEAIEDHGLVFREEMIVELGEQHPYQGCLKALNREPRPTALIVGLGYMVPEVLEAIAFKELGVPQELSLLVLGTCDAGDHFVPRLTRKEQPDEQIGQDAVSYLIAQMEGDDAVIQRYYDVSLVIRESTGPVGG